MPEAAETLMRLGSAGLIGLLVGLQREYDLIQESERTSAGARTFALIGLSGAIAAMAADRLDQPLVWGAAALIVGAMIVAGYIAEATEGHVGTTTEVAALITFIAGSLCYWNDLAIAAAVGVTTTLLLAMKVEAQRFARALDRADIIAAVKFAAISALILPVLPNRSIGPEPIDVINPFTTWLLVVLISGISFLGYALVKIIGPKRGIGVTGLVGGLASSTAVTIAFAQRSRDSTGLERMLAFAVIVAWTTMYARVAVEVAVINRPLLVLLAWPLAVMTLVGLGVGAWLYQRGVDAESESETPRIDNPFGLTPAITFGALFVVIKIAAHLAQLWLGDVGVYASSLLAGIADVDAITLSMAQLSSGPSGLELETAGRAILLATISNTLVKGAVVTFIGTTAMRRAIAPGVVLLVLTGAVAIWLI